MRTAPPTLELELSSNDDATPHLAFTAWPRLCKCRFVIDRDSLT